jgi:bacillithiol system protein YtxJ
MAELRTIATPEEIDELIERSLEAPVWIFKHSLTCPTSATAWAQYRSFVAERPAGDETTYALLEVQRARAASNTVAERTGVRHESPQAILFKDGKVAWHASHWKIRKETLEGV